MNGHEGMYSSCLKFVITSASNFLAFCHVLVRAVIWHSPCILFSVLVLTGMPLNNMIFKSVQCHLQVTKPTTYHQYGKQSRHVTKKIFLEEVRLFAP